MSRECRLSIYAEPAQSVALPVQLQSKLNLPLAGLRRTGELAGVRDQVPGAVEDLHFRRLEIRMVEQVERFGAELEPYAVTEQEKILEQREIVLLQPRAAQRIAPQVPQRAKR